MAKTQKNNIREQIKNLTEAFFSEKGFSLYNVEFKKEGPDWYLRVYIDREDGEYVSTDDCEEVSRFLSEELDRVDPIQQNYFLEVSSPGMDRELFLPEHFQRFAGEIVDVKLYKAIDGQKEFQGTLVGLEEGKIIIEEPQTKKGAEPIRREFLQESVAKTNLAVIF